MENKERELSFGEAIKIVNNHKKNKNNAIFCLSLSIVSAIFTSSICIFNILSGNNYIVIGGLLVFTNVLVMGKDICALVIENKNNKKALKQMAKVTKKLKQKNMGTSNLNKFKLVKSLEKTPGTMINIYDRADSKFQDIVIEETPVQNRERDLSDGTPVMVDTGEYDYNVFYCDADLKKDPVLRK